MAGVVILAVGVCAALAVPPLLAAAEAEPSSTDAAPPDAPATRVVSATPVPEPVRAPVDWDSFTVEQEMAISDRQTPQNLAINAVQEAFPDDYAYGYITDEGFGMSFKADAPPEALAILDAVGDPYELHENVGFTELDAQSQLNPAVDLVQAAVGTQGMMASVNVFTVTVEIELYPDSDDNDDPIVLDGGQLEQLADAIRPVLYPGFDVEITQVRGAQIGF
ncbi:hypothetical protein CTB96_03310 [Cryobacterium arcticum]|uniref:Uncharacterized protein n=1 Tax=Cryobacterium arcticum TaxID=670052 RepID=A0A318A115_9MICO|nr:hypothetical protein CTB96_03310 [Cryobacterium arcticum]